jgi:hypothetical protein
MPHACTCPAAPPDNNNAPVIPYKMAFDLRGTKITGVANVLQIAACILTWQGQSQTLCRGFGSCCMFFELRWLMIKVMLIRSKWQHVLISEGQSKRFRYFSASGSMSFDLRGPIKRVDRQPGCGTFHTNWCRLSTTQISGEMSLFQQAGPRRLRYNQARHLKVPSCTGGGGCLCQAPQQCLLTWPLHLPRRLWRGGPLGGTSWRF